MDLSTAIVGVLIGGALTAIGFLYKRRLDNLTIRNRSLYSLLVMYRSVNLASINAMELGKLMVETLNELVPESKSDPEIESVEQLYGELLSALLSNSAETEESLLQMYIDAVEDLSKVDPVLAYRLSANAGLKKYLALADEETAKIRSKASADLTEDDMRYVKACHDESANLATREVIRELKIDLLLLSVRCGLLQFISVARRLRRKPGLTNQEKEAFKSKIRDILLTQIEERNRGHA